MIVVVHIRRYSSGSSDCWNDQLIMEIVVGHNDDFWLWW